MHQESYSLAYKNFFYVPPTKEHICKWYQPYFPEKNGAIVT